MITLPITDTPQRGFYKMSLVRGGIEVPVMIWWGRPIIDGETQDRAPRWCVAINVFSDRIDRSDSGLRWWRAPIDVELAWPSCAKHPISHHEYAFLRRRTRWAVEHMPDHPAANPYKPMNVAKLPAAF